MMFIYNSFGCGLTISSSGSDDGLNLDLMIVNGMIPHFHVLATRVFTPRMF